MTSKAKLGTGGLYWQEIGDRNYARLTDVIEAKNAEIAELKQLNEYYATWKDIYFEQWQEEIAKRS